MERRYDLLSISNPVWGSSRIAEVVAFAVIIDYPCILSFWCGAMISWLPGTSPKQIRSWRSWGYPQSIGSSRQYQEVDMWFCLLELDSHRCMKWIERKALCVNDHPILTSCSAKILQQLKLLSLCTAAALPFASWRVPNCCGSCFGCRTYVQLLYLALGRGRPICGAALAVLRSDVVELNHHRAAFWCPQLP
jgi:hypothetical protein